MTATQLALWLRTAPAERAAALDDLVGSGDLRFVAADDGITVTKTHTSDLTRLETGAAPMLPPAVG